MSVSISVVLGLCSVESAVELRRFSHVASCDQNGEHTSHLMNVLWTVDINSTVA